jgi:hypothetical protein
MAMGAGIGVLTVTQGALVAAVPGNLGSRGDQGVEGPGAPEAGALAVQALGDRGRIRAPTLEA